MGKTDLAILRAHLGRRIIFNRRRIIREILYFLAESVFNAIVVEELWVSSPSNDHIILK